MVRAPSAAPATYALSLVGVTFDYGRGFSLAVPDMQVAAGEHILLSGRSGSGKSTLLALIAGLESVRTGSVWIHGTDLTKLGTAARDAFRGRHIGMIFQTLNLLPGFSAHENVALALMLAGCTPAEQSTRAQQALALLGITETAARVETLSIGQQQRVAVARAVSVKPSVILADEPTASLDPTNARTTIDLIQTAARNAGAALIVTSHDPSLRSDFARVIDVEAFAGQRGAR